MRAFGGGVHEEIELGQGEDQRLTDKPAGEPRLAASPAPEASERSGASGVDPVTTEESFEVGGQVGGRGIPVLGPLFEALQADALQVHGGLWADPPRRGRLLLDELSEGLVDRRGAERGPAGQELIQDRTETIDVGRRADPAADGLLGCHVGRRAQHGAGGRQVAGPLLGPLGQPEVGDVGPTRRIDQDIRRFEVAMDQPATMRMMDRLRDRDH